MTTEEILFEAEEGMEKAVHFMSHEFAAIRTGKASPALVENIDVEAYGSSMKLKQLALISAPEPRLLVIQPFDAATVRDIERAINESRIGINPAVDGKLIRLPIPELSEERRRDMVKLIKQLAEEAKVRLRSARKTGLDEAKKMKADVILTEDSFKDYEKQVQDLTNKYTKKIDELAVAKEEDLMKI